MIIGAGHAGLAMSRCLTERSIDHVVLERGEVAHSWRTERWDSLLMGAVFLRRRKSTLIDGAGDDARDLSAHLAFSLENRSAR